MDSDADGIEDFDAVVVDPDLLWRTQVANELRRPRGGRRLNAVDSPTLLGAADELTPTTPSVIVVGPRGVRDAIAELPRLGEVQPACRVIAVLDDLGSSDALAALRAGVAEVAPTDEGTADLAGRVDELLGTLRGHRAAAQGAGTHREAEPGSGPTRTLIVVTGAKAGQGATTVAAAIALSLAERQPGRVSLVDADRRLGDQAVRFGLPAPPIGDSPDLHDANGLEIVVAGRSAYPATPPGPEETAITLAAATGDIVVVDAPIDTVLESDVALAADQVVLVCRADLASLKNATVAAELLDGARSVSVVIDAWGELDDVPRPSRATIGERIGFPVVAELPARRGLAWIPPEPDAQVREALEPLLERLSEARAD